MIGKDRQEGKHQTAVRTVGLPRVCGSVTAWKRRDWHLKSGASSPAVFFK
jgi:hypothetical protein